MTINKEFFNRETNIAAKVICDSISPDGKRLTTLEIEYPRFIHAEFMTHRDLSKNSSSSRAIPIQKMIEQIESNMAVPLYWGKTQKGMQAGEEIDTIPYAKQVWGTGFYCALDQAVLLESEGLHKQVPNRLLEPFQMMKVVVTGTNWDNFFNLRIHPDAQPEIAMLAYKIYQAMEASKPIALKAGEWHLPYVDSSFELSPEGLPLDNSIRYHIGEVATDSFQYLTLEEAIKISAASCAAVSYRTEGMTLEKADKIFDMLIKADVIHASPLEHLATPVAACEVVYQDSDYVFEDPKYDFNKSINVMHLPNTWQKGVTHVNKQGELCSGNLVGWIQYRHTLQGNTCWKFNFDERMELFNA